MFLNGQYQVAYVTHDLEAAVAIFEKQFDTPEFRQISGGSDGPGLPVFTDHGDDHMSVKAAVAKIDNMFVEIIEPVSGAVDFYRQFIDTSEPMRFHHIAMAIDDIDAARVKSEALGRKPVVWGSYPGGHFLYVDARATLGHYLEYVAKTS